MTSLWIRLAVVPFIVGGFAGACGGSDDDGGGSSGATDARDRFDPATATLNEKVERYQELAERRNVAPGDVISRAEIPSVAANLCDNSVQDMRFYLEAGDLIRDAEDYAAGGASVIDAFCPSARLQYEAAADALQIRLPAPPED